MSGSRRGERGYRIAKYKAQNNNEKPLRETCQSLIVTVIATTTTSAAIPIAHYSILAARFQLQPIGPDSIIIQAQLVDVICACLVVLESDALIALRVFVVHEEPLYPVRFTVSTNNTN
ncbi:hypothetical protein K457DRAFT_126544 [Linnemannia elongata AG-77]|uniref:Uncharacterized protein n=1 Tax=Linnemannia elongata AG-77 TaxID=1314771 RepID=A0A197JU30_9FUNG|nr:hypothetical protein K457DRAFT_126544 [Linnemannia elongata AG-77]